MANRIRHFGTGDKKSWYINGTVETGDAVTQIAAEDRTMGRGSDGDVLLGIATRIDDDGQGGCTMTGCNETVTFKRSGAIPNGLQVLLVDGAGKVKAGTVTTAGSRVTASFTEDGVDYVEVAL